MQNTTSPLSMLYAMPPLFDGSQASNPSNPQHQLKQQLGAALQQDGLAAPPAAPQETNVPAVPVCFD